MRRGEEPERRHRRHRRRGHRRQTQRPERGGPPVSDRFDPSRAQEDERQERKRLAHRQLGEAERLFERGEVDQRRHGGGDPREHDGHTRAGARARRGRAGAEFCSGCRGARQRSQAIKTPGTVALRESRPAATLACYAARPCASSLPLSLLLGSVLIAAVRRRRSAGRSHAHPRRRTRARQLHLRQPPPSLPATANGRSTRTAAATTSSGCPRRDGHRKLDNGQRPHPLRHRDRPRAARTRTPTTSASTTTTKEAASRARRGSWTKEELAAIEADLPAAARPAAGVAPSLPRAVRPGPAARRPVAQRLRLRRHERRRRARSGTRLAAQAADPADKCSWATGEDRGGHGPRLPSRRSPTTTATWRSPTSTATARSTSASRSTSGVWWRWPTTARGRSDWRARAFPSRPSGSRRACFSSRTLAAADWDRDGRVDLLAAGDGPRMGARNRRRCPRHRLVPEPRRRLMEERRRPGARLLRRIALGRTTSTATATTISRSDRA